MKNLLILITMLITNFNICKSFATDYNAIAHEMKNSIDNNALISEQSARENIESYQGADVDEANYYNNHSLMESNAESQISSDETAEIVIDSNTEAQQYDIDLDEDWLAGANNASERPYDHLKLITNTYQDCSANARSCKFFQGINYKICNADRKIEVDSYHKFQCNKDKLQYNINCTETLNVNCNSAQYSLPHVTHQGFNQFSFSGTTLHLGINRSSGSCAGKDFHFRFHINDPAEIEQFLYNRIAVDDRAYLYINNIQAHTTGTQRCEWGRTTFRFPNINLKPYLKSGENTITIKHIIGGLGNLNAWFTLKYKKCNNYSHNGFIENCETKKFSEDSCTEINKICTEAGSTKHVGNGVYEYRDCWKYEVTQNCIPSNYINYCEDLENNSSCSQLSNECIKDNENYCLQYQNTYRCNHNEIDLTENQSAYLGYIQNITKEYVDYQECEELDSNPSCTITEESCKSIGIRRVDGLELDRDCWSYKRSYACADPDLTQSSCTKLESQCSFHNQECKELDSSGICTEYQRNYTCANAPYDPDSDKQMVLCNNQVYCNNGDCDEITYEKNKDLATTASYASMLENAAAELEEDGSFTFAGTNNKCSRDFLNLSDCCSMDGFAEDFVNTVTDTALLGSRLLVNSITQKESLELGMDLTFCSASEKDLFFRRNNNQCLYIGRYCSAEEDITGLCLQEKESYCCFSSKIAKIIQQQGRPQIGKGWGTPYAPDCTGLTADEINQLDLEKMDFSELEQEIKENALNNLPESSELEGVATEKIKDFFQSGQENE